MLGSIRPRVTRFSSHEHSVFYRATPPKRRVVQTSPCAANRAANLDWRACAHPDRVAIAGAPYLEMMRALGRFCSCRDDQYRAGRVGQNCLTHTSEHCVEETTVSM